MSAEPKWITEPLTIQELERLRPKVIEKIDTRILVTLRHVGGEERAVVVESATEDGSLHVRWESGAGVYVVHVFKAFGNRGGGWLFHTSRSRQPLQWQAVDAEGAKDLWRRMTGRKDVMSRGEYFARLRGGKVR